MAQKLKKPTFYHQGPLVIAAIFFSFAVMIQSQLEKPDLEISKQESALNLNITFLKTFSLGNKRLIANVLWIKTLLESDQEKYKMRHSYSDWMFLRFLSISKLDPWFYENYLYGGIYLSVIKDDLEGAAVILERGLSKYPDDYNLNYYSGFNYFFEMGDYEKGYERLKKLANHPKTPINLKFVINKLQFETTGNFDITINFLKENLKLAQNESMKQKIITDIYSLVAERDLKCLNGHKKNCQERDAAGYPYIQDANGNWISHFKTKEFKIYRPARYTK